jgi:hypothetical protein
MKNKSEKNQGNMNATAPSFIVQGAAFTTSTPSTDGPQSIEKLPADIEENKYKIKELEAKLQKLEIKIAEVDKTSALRKVDAIKWGVTSVAGFFVLAILLATFLTKLINTP